MSYPPPPAVEAGPQDLRPDQVDALLRHVDAQRVQEKDGMNHLEAWDVRRWLTRIFGFGGWSEIVLEKTKVYQEEVSKGRWTVVYEAAVRLVVRTADGRVLATYDGVATGDAQNQKGAGNALDLALKSSTSQALKRAATNLGDQFGLSLYNKGSMAAVVQRTLGNPIPTGEGDQKAPEYKDEPVQPEDAPPADKPEEVDLEAQHQATSKAVAQAYVDLASTPAATPELVWHLGKEYQVKGFDPTVKIKRPDNGKPHQYDLFMRERHNALKAAADAAAGAGKGGGGKAPQNGQGGGQPAAGDAKAGAAQARGAMRQGRDQGRQQRGRQQQAGRAGAGTDQEGGQAGALADPGFLDDVADQGGIGDECPTMADPATCKHPDGYTWADDGKGHSGSFCLLCGTPEPEGDPHGQPAVEEPPTRPDWDWPAAGQQQRPRPGDDPDWGRYTGD